MQELRFVLIIVGALAIAALLFHGLWTSRKEARSKFGDKPPGTFNQGKEALPKTVSRGFQGDKDLKKKRKEPGFAPDRAPDPLIDDYVHPDEEDSDSEVLEPMVIREEMSAHQEHQVISRRAMNRQDTDRQHMDGQQDGLSKDEITETEAQAGDGQENEDDYDVIVLNVHCAGAEPFVGTKLFDSMQQNGLVYGEMDIYHRYADISGTGKVLFSTANILQPGSLKHDDPAEFTTKGITFFMTLPCYGDPEQNFKLMLKTAQQIADDLGGNVLDDQRSLMTPDRLGEYRRQIQLFKAKTA